MKKKSMSTGKIVIRPKPKDLSKTVKQIARYAGGSRYRMDEEMEKKTALILERAGNLIHPAFAYSIHEISRLKSEICAGIFCLKMMLKPQKLPHAFAH